MKRKHFRIRCFAAAASLIIITSCSGRKTIQPSLAPATDEVSLFAPGLISTEGNERDMAISPEGNEIFFTYSTPDNKLGALIRLKKQGDKWLSPEVAPFSGTYRDIEPFFSPDGQKLFFASNRPLFEGDNSIDYNIWYVMKEGDGWGYPASVGEKINTEADEFFPAVGASGNLYFTAVYKDSKGYEDIYMSRFTKAGYQQPVSLDSAVNSPLYEFNAWVSPNEDMIIFTSYGREDDMGGGDLYISRKNNTGNWLPAEHMPPGINSSSLDYCPFVDMTNQNLYFTSKRGINADTLELPLKIETLKQISNGILNGSGNIYKVKL